VSAQQVGEEAKKFLAELVSAFGLVGTVELREEGDDLELTVAGSDLGLMVGPRGNTLVAVQDLTRVASQRRLGDHDTRLRVDIGGYRERRREALSRFANQIAEQVIASGEARALEPMSSADRKVIHDVLTDNAAVVTRSEGEDPVRRIVIAPANA
jgi:spoIIIJ-associated protein